MLEQFCPIISNFSAFSSVKGKPKPTISKKLRTSPGKKPPPEITKVTQEDMKMEKEPVTCSLNESNVNLKIFMGKCFYFNFAKNYNGQSKLELISNVIDNGGVQATILNSNVDYIICLKTSNDDSNLKLKKAKRLNIPIISYDFVEKCIVECKILDVEPFLLSNDSKSEHFQLGTITLSNDNFSKPKKLSLASSKLQNVISQPYNENPSSLESYVLLKFVKLKGKTVTINSPGNVVVNFPFCVLELHAEIKENYEKPNSYCVFSHEGEMKDLDRDKTKQICRFVSNVQDALKIYAQIVKQLTGAPKYLKCTQELLSEKIGSPALQKIQAQLNVNHVKPEVVDLINSLWQEIIRNLEECDVTNDAPLSLPSWKIKELIKILHQINFIYKNGSNKKDEAIISRLSREFYQILKPNDEEKLIGQSELRKLYSFCEKLNDLVQLMESYPLDIKLDPEACYRALRCDINLIEPDTQEYSNISDLVLNSETDFVIRNIFSIAKNSESVLFRGDLGSSRLLFHGISPGNFMGIISRSLQTPNLDFAPNDNLLGPGIYFTDSSSFAAKYCPVLAKTTSGRRFLLICEIALGNIYQTNVAEQSLTSPPIGFDSVMGVKGTGSCFSDNEYVIYDNRQCKLRYLVEFNYPEDDCQLVQMKPRLSCPIQPKTIQDNEQYTYDVPTSPSSPSTADVAGLECIDSGKNGMLSLGEIHVRSRIVDLVAKVYLFQTYFNVSDTPLEVQYVFPLDNGSAICGFEAFMGDKHIVGEVKEKETARQEYNEAKKQGHGAYLLEQSSRNVFTIQVGNIPAHTSAVLKITYIAELTVENDSVTLNIPSLFQRKGNEVTPQFSFEASAEMATEILSIASPTHRVIRKQTDTKAVIKLVPQLPTLQEYVHDIPDLILLIKIANIHVPRMWIEKHPKLDTRACMVTFYPEFQSDPDYGCSTNSVRKPVVFLIDASDTMKASFQDLITLVLLLLDKMKLDTPFNMVAFGTYQRELFPTAHAPLNTDTRNKAMEFVSDLQPNMGKALLAQTLRSRALMSSNDEETDFILITNGVGLESDYALNKSFNTTTFRVFSLGIGHKRNQHLVQLISRRTGGLYVNFHGSERKETWPLKVQKVIEKSNQPCLRDIKVLWQNEDSVLQAPKMLFSIFSGFSQMIYALDTFCTVATLKAKIGHQEVSTVVSTHELSQTTDSMIHSLAARAYVQDWEDGLLDDNEILNMVAKDDAKNNVIAFAKENSLVTSLTSFIAVEKREENEEFTQVSVDTLLEKLAIDILSYMAFVEEDIQLDLEPNDTEDIALDRVEEAQVFYKECASLKKKKKKKMTLSTLNDNPSEDVEMMKRVAMSSLSVEPKDVTLKFKRRCLTGKNPRKRVANEKVGTPERVGLPSADDKMCYKALNVESKELSSTDVEEYFKSDSVSTKLETANFRVQRRMASDRSRSRSPGDNIESQSSSDDFMELEAANFRVQRMMESDRSRSRSPGDNIESQSYSDDFMEPDDAYEVLNSSVMMMPDSEALCLDFSEEESCLPSNDNGNAGYVPMSPSYAPASPSYELTSQITKNSNTTENVNIEIQLQSNVEASRTASSALIMKPIFDRDHHFKQPDPTAPLGSTFGAIATSNSLNFSAPAPPSPRTFGVGCPVLLKKTHKPSKAPMEKIVAMPVNATSNTLTFGASPISVAPPMPSRSFFASAALKVPPLAVPPPPPRFGAGFFSPLKQVAPKPTEAPLGNIGETPGKGISSAMTFGGSPAPIGAPPPGGSFGGGFSSAMTFGGSPAPIGAPPPGGSFGGGFSSLFKQPIGAMPRLSYSEATANTCAFGVSSAPRGPSFGSINQSSFEAPSGYFGVATAHKETIPTPTILLDSNEDNFTSMSSRYASRKSREVQVATREGTMPKPTLLKSYNEDTDSFSTFFETNSLVQCKQRVLGNPNCPFIKHQFDSSISQGIIALFNQFAGRSDLQFHRAMSFYNENFKVKGGSLPILSSIVEKLKSDHGVGLSLAVDNFNLSTCEVQSCLCHAIALMERQLNNNGLNSLGTVISSQILKLVRDLTILEVILILILTELETDFLLDVQSSFDLVVESIIGHLNSESYKDFKDYFVSVSRFYINKDFDRVYPLLYDTLETGCKSWEEYVLIHLVLSHSALRY